MSVKTNVVDMQLGDKLPCRYTALTSGQPGAFSELGTCTAVEIPITGNATPDGKFNFIKVAPGLLIADRVVQTNISWDALNATKLIEGYVLINKIPIMTSNITPYGEIIYKDVYAANPNYQPVGAFNKRDGGSGSNNSYGSNSLPAYLGYKFISKEIINCFSITARNEDTYDYTVMPVDFTFEAQRDDGTWTTLFTRTGETWRAGKSNESKTYYFNNNTAYIAYRLNVSKVVSASVFGCGELCMYDSKLGVRSLSGGCAYADANGNKSTSDQNKGAWPTNEWDKIIVESTLGGAITPGDNVVWHWKTFSFTKDTPINGMAISGASTNNTARTIRGIPDSFPNPSHRVDHFNFTYSNSVNALFGFRPVLEYVESNSKQSNLWH